VRPAELVALADEYGTVEAAIAARPELEERLRRSQPNFSAVAEGMAALRRQLAARVEVQQRALAPVRENVAHVARALAATTACSWQKRRLRRPPLRARRAATRRARPRRASRARSPSRRSEPDPHLAGSLLDRLSAVLGFLPASARYRFFLPLPERTQAPLWTYLRQRLRADMSATRPAGAT
jgi:hypothetical protein